MKLIQVYLIGVHSSKQPHHANELCNIARKDLLWQPGCLRAVGHAATLLASVHFLSRLCGHLHFPTGWNQLLPGWTPSLSLFLSLSPSLSFSRSNRHSISRSSICVAMCVNGKAFHTPFNVTAHITENAFKRLLVSRLRLIIEFIYSCYIVFPFLFFLSFVSGGLSFNIVFYLLLNLTPI